MHSSKEIAGETAEKQNESQMIAPDLPPLPGDQRVHNPIYESVVNTAGTITTGRSRLFSSINSNKKQTTTRICQER